MRAFLIVLTGIFCLFYIKMMKKRLFSVSGLFILMWTVCGGFSALGLYGVNKPSYTVVFLICCTMVIFALCGTIKIKLFSFGNRKKHFKNVIRGISQNKLLLILNICSYIFLIPYLPKTINIYATMGIYYVRQYAFEGSNVYMSTLSLTISQTIIQPLYIATMLFVFLDVSRKKAKLGPILIVITDILLYTVMFAGRYMLLQAMCFLLFAMYDVNYVRSVVYFIKNHIKICLSILVIVCALIGVTQKRTDAIFFKGLYVYFCGSFSYLSYLVENKIGTNLFLLGRTQMGFIYNFIYMIATYVFGVPYNGSNHIVTQLTAYMVPIGEGVTYNSLGTMLHDFMADYGVYGSLFGVLVFALFCNYVEKCRYRNATIFAETFYYYVLFMIVNSVLGYTLRGSGAFVVIGLLFVFGYKKKYMKEGELA